MNTNGYISHCVVGLMFYQPSSLHALARDRVMVGRRCEDDQAM